MEVYSTYKWKPITDLPKDWGTLSSPRLQSLAEVWREQRQKFDQAAIVEFNERLKRQWAIETGIIENLYTLDRGITLLLIEHGIIASLIPHGTTNKPVDHVVNLIADQKNVVEGLFDFVGSTRQLTTSYIKEIHAALTIHQETVDGLDSLGRTVSTVLKRGEWKSSPNNPSRADGYYHEYCPPEQVASEMDRLIEMHLRHQQEGVTPEIEAAWLHHRFTQIHPFQDGNGRVARALATLIVLKAGWFPLVVLSDERVKYIEALEEADRDNLEPLVEFFGRLAESSFLKALTISDRIISDQRTYQSMMTAVAERFRQRSAVNVEEQNKVISVADLLCQRTLVSLNRLTSDLTSVITPYNKNVNIGVDNAGKKTKNWFWDQVVATAKQRDYYANLRYYHNWVRLKIKENRQVEIVVSFHPMGAEFVGVMGASAFIEYRSRDEEGVNKIDGPYAICERVFVFTYKNDERQTSDAFDQWLNEVIINGVEEWRRQL